MGIDDLGGGDAYPFKVLPSMADVIVSDRDTLEAELASAEYGDVIYIDGSASIYVGSDSERLTVPRGATLASDRGIGGSNGALVHTDATWGLGADGMIEAEEEARITGIRAKGSVDDTVSWMEYDGSYEMAGVRAIGPNVEVDNCDISYFGHSQVLGDNGSHIHHNYLHHANMKGLGYGVMTGNSPDLPVVEYNLFEHWRHAVADGGDGGGYIFRYNRCVGPAISHAIDQHDTNGVAGTEVQIYNNKVEHVFHDEDSTNQLQSVAIRGVPEKIALIRHNWFYNPDPPAENPDFYWSDDEAIIQVDVNDDGITEWTNVEWNHNQYAETPEPRENIGQPR